MCARFGSKRKRKCAPNKIPPSSIISRRCKRRSKFWSTVSTAIWFSPRGVSPIYVLLTREGDVIIKGGALKSRGREKFQRVFLEEMIKFIMQGKPEAVGDLRDEFERKIRNREWKIDMLMKTDTLQDSLDKYRAKIAGSARNRAAAYELALASGRNYKPGDQISYYIKATPKKVPAYEAPKLASDFDPQNRDENVDYYVAKLDDLMQKFGGLATTASAPEQENLAL